MRIIENRIKLILIAFLSIVLIYGIFIRIQFKSLKNRTAETNQMLLYREQDISLLKQESVEITETILSYLSIDGLVLKNIKLTKSDLIQVDEKSNNKNIAIELKRIIDQEKIVLRFFQTSCSSCVTEQLAKLYLLSKKIGMKKIVLLPDYLNQDIQWYMIKNKINLEVYETQNADLGLEFDKQQIPYIFICDPKLKVNMPFVLSLKSKGYSEYFYNSISDRIK